MKKLPTYNNYSYTLLLPGLIIYVVFLIVPSILSFYYSLTYWDIVTTRFIGLTNFKNILMIPDINISVKNTMIFALLTTILKTLVGLILAVFLNRQIKSRNFVRSAFFVPALLNNVGVGLIFVTMLHPTRGLLNRILESVNLGFAAQDWLMNPKLTIYSLCGIEVWKWSGFAMVILLGGLQSISKEFYEAAEIDGASGRQRFFHITVPLLMPFINNCLMLNLIGGLKVFDLVYATTQGGPGNASEVMSTYAFKAFGKGLYGEATAASVLQGIFVAVIVLTANTLARRREVDM